ncbi:hypothetical protein MMPV_005555 [Pyropia vietnamensis]
MANLGATAPAFLAPSAWPLRPPVLASPLSFPPRTTAPVRRAATTPARATRRVRAPPSASFTPPPVDTEEIRRRAEAAGAAARNEGARAAARGAAVSAEASRSGERALNALEAGLRSLLPSSAAALPPGARSLFFLAAVVGGGAVLGSALLAAIAALAVATLTVVSLLLPVGILLVPFSMVAGGLLSLFASAALKLGAFAFVARIGWTGVAKVLGLSPPAPASRGAGTTTAESEAEEDDRVRGAWEAELNQFDSKLRSATGIGLGGSSSGRSGTSSIRDWSVVQVGEALRAAGLGEYVGAFAAQQVDGATAAGLTAAELRVEFPAIPMGDRRRILELFEQLA